MIVAMVANMGGLNEQERDIQATRIAIATTSPRLVREAAGIGRTRSP
jgi:hypothetical protein